MAKFILIWVNRFALFLRYDLLTGVEWLNKEENPQKLGLEDGFCLKNRICRFLRIGALLVRFDHSRTDPGRRKAEKKEMRKPWKYSWYHSKTQNNREKIFSPKDEFARLLPSFFYLFLLFYEIYSSTKFILVFNICHHGTIHRVRSAFWCIPSSLEFPKLPQKEAMMIGALTVRMEGIEVVLAIGDDP